MGAPLRAGGHGPPCLSQRQEERWQGGGGWGLLGPQQGQRWLWSESSGQVCAGSGQVEKGSGGRARRKWEETTAGLVASKGGYRDGEGLWDGFPQDGGLSLVPGAVPACQLCCPTPSPAPGGSATSPWRPSAEVLGLGWRCAVRASTEALSCTGPGVCLPPGAQVQREGPTLCGVWSAMGPLEPFLRHFLVPLPPGMCCGPAERVPQGVGTRP